MLAALTTGCENKLNKAQQLLKMGSYPEARKIAEEEVASSPDDLRAHLILGMAKVSQASANGDDNLYKEGLRELGIAVKGEEMGPLASFLLGLAHLRNPRGANKQEAVKALERALSAKVPEKRAIRYLVSLSQDARTKHKKHLSSLGDNKAAKKWSYVRPQRVSSFVVPVPLIMAVPNSKRRKSRPLYLFHTQEVEEETATHYLFKERIYRHRTGFVSALASTRLSGAQIERMNIYPSRSLFGLRGRPASRSRIKSGSARAVRPAALNAWIVKYEYRVGTKVFSVPKNQVRPGTGVLAIDKQRIRVATGHIEDWGMEHVLRLLSMGMAEGLTFEEVEAAVGPVNCTALAINEKTTKEKCSNSQVAVEFVDGLLKSFKAPSGSGVTLVEGDKLAKLAPPMETAPKYAKGCTAKDKTFFNTFYTFIMADRQDLVAPYIQFKNKAKPKAKPAFEDLPTLKEFLEAVTEETERMPEKLYRGSDVPTVKCQADKMTAAIGTSRLTFNKAGDKYLLGRSIKVLGCGGEDTEEVCHEEGTGSIAGISSDGSRLVVYYNNPRDRHERKRGSMDDTSSLALMDTANQEVVQSFPSLCISSIPTGTKGMAYQGCVRKRADAFERTSARLTLLQLNSKSTDKCEVAKSAEGLTISSKKLGAAGLKVPHTEVLAEGEPAVCMTGLAWRASCLKISEKEIVVDISLAVCGDDDEPCKQANAAGCAMKKPAAGMPLIKVFDI